MPDWEHCFLNVSRYFNEGTEEYVKFDLYSNSTLGRCFEVCDYGLYKTSTEIKWGDCLVNTWADTDVTFDNWHILAFKPAQQDASTAEHSGGLLRTHPRKRAGIRLSLSRHEQDPAGGTQSAHARQARAPPPRNGIPRG